MAHHHHHSHDHSHHKKSHHIDFNMAFFLAITINAGFSVAEILFALMANSMGLLADAVHNLGDVLGLVLAWFAGWLLKRKAKDQFSYGYKKTTILAALINALLIVGGATAIGVESFRKLFLITPINEPIVIALALAGILVNGGTALLFFQDKDKDLNIKGAFLHLAWDALISLAVVAVATVIYFTHWYWIDPIIGLILVAIIYFGTWELLRDSTSLMLAAAPEYIKVEEVKKYLKSIPGVTSIHDLHIWGLSTQEVALTAHLVIPDGDLSDHDHEKINYKLREEYRIDHVTLQIERGHLEDPCGRADTC